MKDRSDLLAAARRGLLHQLKDLPEFPLAVRLGRAVDTYLYDLPLDDASYRAWSDQLARAVWSIPANVAEGHGRGSIAYVVQYGGETARGSAAEVLALLLAAPARFDVPDDLIRLAREVAVSIDERVVKLLEPLYGQGE